MKPARPWSDIRYARNSSVAIVRHFQEIASHTDKPVVVYNIPSRVVVNIERTVHAIQTAMVGAERMAGVRGEAVVVALSGPHISSQNSRGVVAVSRPDREIGEEDVQQLVERRLL